MRSSTLDVVRWDAVRHCKALFARLAIAVALLISFSGIHRLNAQGAGSAIQGVVTDTSGAAISDATVTLSFSGAGSTACSGSSCLTIYGANPLHVGYVAAGATAVEPETISDGQLRLKAGMEEPWQVNQGHVRCCGGCGALFSPGN